jgi:hypothetical protein
MTLTSDGDDSSDEDDSSDDDDSLSEDEVVFVAVRRPTRPPTAGGAGADGDRRNRGVL